jgi:hypothetical protein
MVNKRPKPEEIVTKLCQRVACWKSGLTVCMMSALDHKRTSDAPAKYVFFAPESGHNSGCG